MFNELPKGFKEVETDRKKELVHTCTINDDGQVIFGTKFLKKGSLLSKKEATFVKLLWNESEQQLIFAFASEEEIHGDDPDFDESSLGEEIFKLEKMKTAKGLKVALRDRCSEKLIPPENYDYYFFKQRSIYCIFYVCGFFTTIKYKYYNNYFYVFVVDLLNYVMNCSTFCN